MYQQNITSPEVFRATAILDYTHPLIYTLLDQLNHAVLGDRAFLQAAHSHLARTIRPTYSLDEFQPASETLRKRQGSCSQRMACWEAIARGYGIGTQVRALWVDGRFWHPRFRFVRPFIPKRILLAWPQFLLDGVWTDFDELYGSTSELIAQAPPGFTNTDESLFEAIQHTAVDFLGKSCRDDRACPTAAYDLSRFVLADGGFFTTRDALFAHFGSLHQSWRGKAFTILFGG